MKRRAIALLIAILLALPAFAAAQQEVPKSFPYEVHTETLDNGLQALIIPMSSGGLVTYWSVVRTGARDEYEDGRTGFAHFFEHMMFRGTEKYPADVYGDKVTEIGADANAFTTDDFTGYHLTFAKEDLETVMDIESDRFQNLSYPKAMFETEAGAVYGEYRKNRTSPFFTIYEAMVAAAFTKHTYGHTAMGYEEDIKLMPTLFDYSKTFFDRYYRPDNVVLMIIGDVQVEPTRALIRQYYSAWEAGYVAPKVEAEPEQTAEKRIEVAYDGSTLPIVALAYKTPAYDPDDPTFVAGVLLGELLFGETSDLHKKLVLDEQIIEFIQGSMGTNRDPNLFFVMTRVKDIGRIDYVIEEIDKAIAAAQQTPPDAARLADLKSRFKYGFLMGLDTPDNVAGAVAQVIAAHGSIDAIDRAFATLDALGPEDARTAARTYLTPQRRTLGILKGVKQ